MLVAHMGLRSPYFDLGNILRVIAICALPVTAMQSAQGQEYSRFLQCTGSMLDGDKTLPAHVDYAMRLNSRMALIQRSNVLPVGQSLKFVPTPYLYTMSYKLPAQGTQVVAASSWFQTTFLVLYPDLNKLNEIRVSIDRHTGALEGQLLNENAAVLATLQMTCKLESTDADSAPVL